MGEKTAISWCRHTFNAWWGCVRVSEACRFCYAEAFDHRVQGNDRAGHWGPTAARKFFGDKHWNEPRKWHAAAMRDGVRRRVFCSSMSDVFEDREDLLPHRARLWSLIRETPHLDWLLLTKRPQNIERMVPWMDVARPVNDRQIATPYQNVWLGVTAENVECAELRIPILRGIPAAVRFVSCEPILEHIPGDVWDLVFAPHALLGPISWLIVGDESGHGARPAQADWVRAARDAAQRHDIAFHFKQWAGRSVPAGIRSLGPNKGKIHLPLLDGRRWAEFPR